MGRQVTVGRVVRAHGVRGELVVHRFGDSPRLLAAGSRLWLRIGDRDLDLVVRGARPHKREWIVAFEGLGNRNEAQALVGATLLVDADRLPPLEEGTYYDYQLLGLRVVTPGGRGLGRIVNILETGARDVYVVQGGEGEVLIPTAPGVVVEVDLEAGRMIVDPPPGLLPEAGTDGGGVGG